MTKELKEKIKKTVNVQNEKIEIPIGTGIVICRMIKGV